MFEIEDKEPLMTENEKRELMLSLEELAQIEGYRSFAPSGSEFSIQSEVMALINSKADGNEVIKHDGSVALSDDWDIGDGFKLIADQVRARDAAGLKLFDDGGNGIFVEDGGNVGFKIADPVYRVHISGTAAMQDEGVGLQYAIFRFLDSTGATAAYLGKGNHLTNDVEMVTFGGAIQFYANSAWQGRLGSNGNWHFGANTNPSAKVAINGGLHVGGVSDPGNDNLLVDGKVEIDGDLDHDGTNIGFFGVTPVSRQTALNPQLTTLTHSAPGTPDYSIADPINGNAYGFTTADEFKTVMSVISNLQTRLSELEIKLKNYGLLQ